MAIQFYRNYVYLGGFAFFTTSTVYSSLCRYSGKSFIVLGIILILFPLCKSFLKSNSFKEHEVLYTFKDNGMTYQEDEEAIFYSFPQLKELIIKILYFLKKKSKDFIR